MSRWILGGVLLLGVLYLGSLKMRDAREDAELAEQLRLARQEGIPITGKEFGQQLLPAADHENAAPFYRQLAKRIKADGIQEIDRGIVLHPGKELLTRAQQLISANVEPLRIIDQAVRRPRCWFNRDWSEGAAVIFPEYADIKGASRLVALRGTLAAQAGDANSALNEIGIILKMATHVGQEQLTLSRMVEDSLRQMALSHLALWSFRFRDPAYARAMERVINESPKPNLKQENADRLASLLTMIDWSLTPEGRQKIGLKEDQIPPLNTPISMLMNRRTARTSIVKAHRELWAALDEKDDARRQTRIEEALMRRSVALLAFPVAFGVWDALTGEAEILRDRVPSWKANRVQYQALLRALSQKKIPASIVTSDLRSPYDGNPVKYRFSDKQITIEVSGYVDESGKPTSLKVPPGPRSNGFGGQAP